MHSVEMLCFAPINRLNTSTHVMDKYYKTAIGFM